MTTSLFSLPSAPASESQILTEKPADIFALLAASLRQLTDKQGPGMSVVGALKSGWTRSRSISAEINRKQGGRAAAETLTRCADFALETLLNFANQRAGLNGGGIAILAMGSYGRRELAPYSDIDLMILHSPEIADTKLEELAGNLLRPLWDSGLQIGHAVRTPEACLAAMADATDTGLETATSVMEARFVAGDQKFAGEFLESRIPEYFKQRGRLFVDAKFQETLKRWEGKSIYRTQPNLKESPGALRDFQLALWIDDASRLSGHLPRLESRPLVSSAAIQEAQAGYEKLLTFRASLHTLCGRKQDVLDFQMQQSVAKDLGYEDSDELAKTDLLLRDYYRSATAVHRLASTVTRRYIEEQAIATRDLERLRRRPVDADFTRIGDYLYPAHDGVFPVENWIEPAFRAFVHAARMGIAISQSVAEGIRARLPSMDADRRRDPAAAAHFMNLMQMRENVGRVLRSMRDVGLLASYFPEFGEIEGLVLSDSFHDYTVDEHTLFVVQAADQLYASLEGVDQFRRNVLESLPRPQLLRLACLFHDLGKSRGAAGHSERGALMMPTIGERLGLSDSDVRILIFLIEEHLTLSRTSQRRDINEGKLLTEIAAKFESRERLDLLFLLTYCDSISVGYGSYPLWKDALLAELYGGIVRHLKVPLAEETVNTSDAERVTNGGAGLKDQLTAWAQSDEDRALAAEHVERVPKRYLVEVSFDEAVSHLEILRRMRETKKSSVAAVRGSGELVDMWVVSEDRPKRFSQICGAFLGSGVSVVSAIAYTRADGLILDHFRVAPGLDAGSVSAGFWEKVAREIESVLSGEINFQTKIESARKRIPRQPRVIARIPPEVRVDNNFSEQYTVVDVRCGDRIGLLYSLSRALADLHCDIHFAKIATTQGLVTDVFYVSENTGGKITDSEKMLNIKRLLKAVASDYQEERR